MMAGRPSDDRTVFTDHTEPSTMTDFPYETAIPVRYVDHDTLGHVNNAVYATFLEEARIAYFTEALDEPLTDRSMVIASLEMDFLAPVTSQSVTVALDVVDVGDKSFTMEYEVEAAGDVVARAETVQVHVDPETGASMSLPDDWREAFAGGK